MATTSQQRAKQAFAQYVVESMAGLGAVQARPMFGGFGVYLQGLMFALLLDDVVYIKVDEVSVGRFQAHGQTAFIPSVVDASKAVTSEDLQDLLNLGPKSRDMLIKAGIATADELRRVGAVVAYARTKAVWPRASLNLLWALEGALSGRPWQQVAETDRASLLMALEDVERQADLR